MMSGKDSLSLAGFFRTTTRPLVICLTAETGTMNWMQGSDIVADDHVVKSFALRELPTLFRAVLRRVVGNGTTSVHAPGVGKFAFGQWVLQTGDRELTGNDGVATPLCIGCSMHLSPVRTVPSRATSRLTWSQGPRTAAFERTIHNHVAVCIAQWRKAKRTHASSRQSGAMALGSPAAYNEYEPVGAAQPEWPDATADQRRADRERTSEARLAPNMRRPPSSASQAPSITSSALCCWRPHPTVMRASHCC